MPRETIRKTSGAAGEISPSLFGRSDWDGYLLGTASQTNWISMVAGGWELRPGLFRLSAAYASDTAATGARGRVVAFNRSALENYVIEFSDKSLRIWSVVTAGPVLDGSDEILEIETPWDTATLGQLMVIRQADIMIITDAGNTVKPYVLARRGETNWTLSAFDFREGPFKPSPAGVSLAISGTTLTASASVFEAGHVGALIWMRENPSAITTAKWQVDTDVTAGAIREYNGRVYQAGSTAKTGTTPPIHSEGVRSDGLVLWTYLHDGGAIYQITDVASGTSATANLLPGQTAPAAAASTPYWDIQAFNDVDGWPATAMYHQERVWFTGTLSEPDTSYASIVAAYDDTGASFKPGLASGLVKDDDALRLPLADGTVDPTSWMLSVDYLYIGGAGGTRRIVGPGNEETITPGGRLAKALGSHGAARAIPPVRIGKWILFAGIRRRVLRALSLDGEEGEASRHSEHLLAAGIQMMDWQVSTKTLWIVTRLGHLLAFRYDQAQGVEALSPMVLADDGRIESLCVVTRPDGVQTVWALVRFTVDGEIVRELCILTRRWESGLANVDVCYLDRAGYFDADMPDIDEGETTPPPAEAVGGAGDVVLPGVDTGYDTEWSEGFGEGLYPGYRYIP